MAVDLRAAAGEVGRIVAELDLSAVWAVDPGTGREGPADLVIRDGTIAAVHGGVTDRYRFLAEERVHPFSIRRRWQQIERVSFPAGRRGSESGLPQVTFSDAVLWNPLPGEGSA